MISAYVLVEAAPGRAKAVTEEIIRAEGVKRAHCVTGVFDVVAYVEATDPSALSDVVLARIQTIDGVRRTQTAVVAYPLAEKAVKQRVYKSPPPPKEFVEETVRAALAGDPTLADRPLEAASLVRAKAKERGYRGTVTTVQVQAMLRKLK
ncbi:MAG: Lrp/AsnC family transcriptional regulator [Candidatus Bathyarchaeia archaeon]